MKNLKAHYRYILLILLYFRLDEERGVEKSLYKENIIRSEISMLPLIILSQVITNTISNGNNKTQMEQLF